MRRTIDRKAPAPPPEEVAKLVAHELRTPITPLKALAQLIRARLRRAREGGRPLDLHTLDENLAVIERQVDRMDRLINDLVDVTQSGRAPLALEPERCDLVGVVREALHRVEFASLDNGHHRFSFDAPATIPATVDRMRIEQAVVNLVGNAVKYSPDGGDVRVELRRDDDRATITVSDEGIGMSADDVGRVGDPFVRGRGRASTYSGMGVGLYLARLIAERHGGTLELESEGEGKGTTARITLPL